MHIISITHVHVKKIKKKFKIIFNLKCTDKYIYIFTTQINKLVICIIIKLYTD